MLLSLACLAVTVAVLPAITALAQEDQPAADPTTDAVEAGPSAIAPEQPVEGEGEPVAAPEKPKGLSLFGLIRDGGPLMIPIFLMLVLVVAFSIERGLGLRRAKVMPHDLVDSLGTIGHVARRFRSPQGVPRVPAVSLIRVDGDSRDVAQGGATAF